MLAGGKEGRVGRERYVSLDNVAEMMKKKREELEGEEMTGKIYLEKVRRQSLPEKKKSKEEGELAKMLEKWSLNMKEMI